MFVEKTLKISHLLNFKIFLSLFFLSEEKLLPKVCIFKERILGPREDGCRKSTLQRHILSAGPFCFQYLEFLKHFEMKRRGLEDWQKGQVNFKFLEPHFGPEDFCKTKTVFPIPPRNLQSE